MSVSHMSSSEGKAKKKKRNETIKEDDTGSRDRPQVTAHISSCRLQCIHVHCHLEHTHSC